MANGSARSTGGRPDGGWGWMRPVSSSCRSATGSRRKGFQRVLRVNPALLPDFPRSAFRRDCGPGSERDNGPELERQVRALGLDGRVMLIGARPPKAVALWLGAADLFVLASDRRVAPTWFGRRWPAAGQWSPPARA